MPEIIQVEAPEKRKNLYVATSGSCQSALTGQIDFLVSLGLAKFSKRGVILTAIPRKRTKSPQTWDFSSQGSTWDDVSDILILSVIVGMKKSSRGALFSPGLLAIASVSFLGTDCISMFGCLELIVTLFSIPFDTRDFGALASLSEFIYYINPLGFVDSSAPRVKCPMVLNMYPDEDTLDGVIGQS